MINGVQTRSSSTWRRHEGGNGDAAISSMSTRARAGRAIVPVAIARFLIACVAIGSGAGWSRGQAGGSIEGRVSFDGPPPLGVTVVESGTTQKVLHVDSSGGLQYAVVYLADARPGGAIPREPATMDQRLFIFEPQVMAVRAGQLVQFTNSDPAGHNVRSRDLQPENAFNLVTAGAAVEGTHRFASTPAGRPVELSCDIHPWMAAWVYVFDHDQFAVTNRSGRFRIDTVPVGRHRLSVRQPSGRVARELVVDVRPGETTRVEVRFTPADAGMPSR
jgi:plastocyanin